MTTTINASTTAGLVQTADTSGVLALQTAGTTAVSISSAQVVSLAQVLPEASGGTGTSTGYYGFKNRIINGAMVIDQRLAGASNSTSAVNNTYTLDRWQAAYSASSKFSVQQTPSATETGFATRVGAGFRNYLACTSSAATAVGASDYYILSQAIEGFNTADLAWGTANAKTITLSFLVYSSLTGTFGGALNNESFNRGYPFTYSIPVANTWTQISVTVAGDTTGTWTGATSGIGMFVFFGLGAGASASGTAGAWAASGFRSATGAVQVVATNGATFYITGVQLEKGSTATSFDYRPYGTELMLCQRYFAKLQNDAVGADATLAMGMQQSTTSAFFCVKYPVTMRGEPTATISGLAVGDQITFTNAATLTNSFLTFDTATITTTYTTAGAQFRPCCLLILNNTAGSISFSAEL